MKKAMLLAVAVNALWTIFIGFFSLMAESGGKDPSPLATGLAVWALVEVVVTMRRTPSKSPSRDSRSNVGRGLCALLIILRPALDLVPLHNKVTWQVHTLAVSVLVILCARVLRWS